MKKMIDEKTVIQRFFTEEEISDFVESRFPILSVSEQVELIEKESLREQIADDLYDLRSYLQWTEDWFDADEGGVSSELVERFNHETFIAVLRRYHKWGWPE